MAFTREFIRKLAKESDVELPKEFIDGIVSEHLNARNAYAEEQVKAELANSQTNVEDSEEYKALKKLYDDERTSYKKFKDEVTEKETKGKKIEVFKKLLQQSGVSAKRIDAVIKVSDDVINNIEFNEKGEVKDVDKITEGIKSEWSDFIMKPEQIKADIPSPPVLGGDTGNTKEHRAAKIAAEYHKSLYGDSGVKNSEVNTTQNKS